MRTTSNSGSAKRKLKGRAGAQHRFPPSYRSLRKNTLTSSTSSSGCSSAAKWPPARHLGPLHEVIAGLHPLPGRHEDFLRKQGARSGHVHASLDGGGDTVLVIDSSGRCAGLGDPVEHDIRQQLVLCEAALDISVAVTPLAELLDNPRCQARWGIVEAVPEALGLRRLDLLIRTLVGHVGVAFLHPLQLGLRYPGVPVRTRRLGKAEIEMQTCDVLRVLQRDDPADDAAPISPCTP